MKKLLLLCVFLLSADAVSAQVVNTDLPLAPFAVEATTFPQGFGAPLDHETLPVSYHDPSKPAVGWTVYNVIGNNVHIAAGERMTLPGESGFVDSVTIQFSSATGDVINVFLYNDTLLDVQGMQHHLIDVFSPASEAVYASLAFPVSSIPSNGLITVPFDHVEVPKNFFVVVLPNFNQQLQFTSQFNIAAEIKPVRPVTTEDSRSAYLALLPGTPTSTLTDIFDGRFTLQNSDTALFAEFHITAHVSVEEEHQQGSVGTEKINLSVRAYPNPVISGDAITLAIGESGVASTKVFDLLGNEVFRSQAVVTGELRIHTNGFAPGVYQVITTVGEKQFRTQIVVND